MNPRSEANLGELAGSEEFQQQEVHALGEVGDVPRSEGQPDVHVRVVEPVGVLGGRRALVEAEVPAVAEDYA